MRAARAVIAAVGICLVGACSSPVDGIATAPAPATRPASPGPPAALDRVLPTADELSRTLGVGTHGLMGQLVVGGADMLLRGIDRSEATPVECVSATHRLQHLVYGASSVRSVASRPWAGGDVDGPARSAFFGVVKLARADDARAFFTAAVANWRECDGRTLMLAQPDHGTRSFSRITDVVLDGRVVSAVVLTDSGLGGADTVARALGVAADCIVDVEVAVDVDPALDPAVTSSGGAIDAVGIANLMLDKISAAA